MPFRLAVPLRPTTGCEPAPAALRLPQRIGPGLRAPRRSRHLNGQPIPHASAAHAPPTARARWPVGLISTSAHPAWGSASRAPARQPVLPGGGPRPKRSVSARRSSFFDRRTPLPTNGPALRTTRAAPERRRIPRPRQFGSPATASRRKGMSTHGPGIGTHASTSRAVVAM